MAHHAPEGRQDKRHVAVDAGVEVVLEVVVDLPSAVVQVDHCLVQCAQLGRVEGREVVWGLPKAGLELVPPLQEQLNCGFLDLFRLHPPR